MTSNNSSTPPVGDNAPQLPTFVTPKLEHLPNTAPPSQSTAPASQGATPATLVGPLLAVPDYAIKYAPLVYLHKDEKYWPASITKHIGLCLFDDCSDNNNPTPVDVASFGPLNIANYLTNASINRDNVFMEYTTDPRKQKDIPTLQSNEGIPDANHRSTSPCWIIWTDKSNVGEGTVDVFYFFFWAYNLGNKVLGVNYGNHVGDWEHIMIRFVHGQPVSIHLSEHSDGVAYTWRAIEKQGDRPVAYCAGGSHAFYAKKGPHAYSKAGFLGPIDYTSTGPLWDPTLNYIATQYDVSKPDGQRFTPVDTHGADPDKTLTPDDIKAILSYRGRWGNSFMDKTKKRDDPLTAKLKQLTWSQGPTGPRDKFLDRTTVNITNGNVSDKL